ncbi:MAG: phosphoribosylanthranilate isomerase [Pseudomonadota bacterium]
MAKIKICGITNLDDAVAAQTYGADAIGFVFAKSPRRVAKETVRRIAVNLPPFIQLVGVFVDDEKETVREIARYCRLNLLQFHGNESPEYCMGFHRKIIKAFRIKDARDIEQMMPYQGIASAFLLDSYNPKLAGGTGQVFDWTIARKALKIGPIILAGGLNPDNVQEAIKAVQPYAIDAGSGVEGSPGKKDHSKMKLLIERAKSA